MKSKRMAVLVLGLAAGLGVAFAILRWMAHSPAHLAEVLAHDPDPAKRMQALEELARLPGEQGADALIAALSDKDASIPRAAAAALAKKRVSRAAGSIAAAMSAQNAYGQLDFAKALGELGDPQSVPAILDAIHAQEKNTGEIDFVVALGKLGPGAVDGLIAALKDKDPRVRAYAAGGLGGIAFQMRGQSEEKAHAATAAAVEPVCALLKDPEALVRHRAADALGSLHDPRAVEPLIAALADPDPKSGEIIARVLAYFPREAVDLLIAALRNDSFPVRRGAAEALGGIALSDSVQPGVRTAIEKAMKEAEQGLLRNNMEFIAGAYLYYIHRAQYAAVPKLINTLGALGDKRMAETFLNCGHAELAEAAKQWAKDNGMKVEERSGGSGQKWGK